MATHSTHWSYTSQPYKILGINYIPFLYGLALFFIFIFIKPPKVIIIALTVIYIISIWYAKKNAIPLSAMPERLARSILPKAKPPKTFKDSRPHDSQ